jgi:hypothetical protein
VRTIWKFPLGGVVSVIEMPKDAQIVHFDAQGGPCLWAIVDPEAEKEYRTFHVVGTGELFPDIVNVEYVATMLTPPFVWHCLEVK